MYEPRLQSLLNKEGDLAEGTPEKKSFLEEEVIRTKRGITIMEETISDYKTKLSKYTPEQLSEVNVRKVSSTGYNPDLYFFRFTKKGSISNTKRNSISNTKRNWVCIR